ncbi:MAG: Ig domain-containing protein [Candidatus Acidiferrales bacterium]
MTISNTYARMKHDSANGNGANDADRMLRLKSVPLPAAIALVCVAIMFMAGCGGSGTSTTITVQIIPGTAQNIDTGQSLTFMATLANDTDNKGVTWAFTGSSCSGAGCGTLTMATPNSVVYTAPTGISATLAVSLQAVSVASKNATATVTINVVLAPTFGTATPPNGANGVPYSFLIPVTGGVAPLTVTLASGTLPAGLTVNSSGAIVGRPTGANTTNVFTVQVADNGNPPIKVMSPQYTIKISAPPALSITSSGALLGATENVTYTTSIVSTGGVPPFTWSKVSGSLPPGLTLNTTSGQISGIPTAAGVFTFTPQVIDSAIPQQTATTAAPLSITVIAPPPLQITPSVLPGGTVATPYTTSVEATGGVLPYTWSVAGGQLPAGLSLNPATGEITGTPIMVSGSPVSFTLGVQDSQAVPATNSRGFSISITAGTANPNTLLHGSYVFFFRGFDTQGVVLATGQLAADGAGKVSGGSEEFNRVSGVTIGATLTGTYGIGTDGRGTMTLTATNAVSQKLTSVYQLVLDSSGNARFFENDASNTTPPPLATRGSGIMKPQVGSSFAATNFSGNYAFAFSGQDLTTAPTSLAGVIHADGASAFTPGTVDFNDAGLFSPSLPASGNFSVNGTAGRAVANLVFQIPSSAQVTMNFVCYFVSPGDLFFIEIDTTDATHPKIGGEMILQQPSTTFNNAALNGGSVVSGTGLEVPNASAFVGLLTSNSTGGATVNFDQNDGGVISLGALVPGTYLVTPNGRVEFSNFGALGSRMTTGYLTGVNQGFLIGSDAAATVGLMENQSGSAPFSGASVKGSYALSAPVAADDTVSSIIGQTSANGVALMQGVVDEVDSSGQNPAQAFVGNYAVGASGQGTMTTNTPTGIPTNLAVYVVSPSKIRMISTDSVDEHPQVIFLDH